MDFGVGSKQNRANVHNLPENLRHTYPNPPKKSIKTQFHENSDFIRARNYIKSMHTKYEGSRSDSDARKKSRKFFWHYFFIWTTSSKHINNKSMNSPRILDFPEIPPTLMSCIFELSEDFFKISKDPERSMSKLSFEPNTIKNGHLAAKLRPI